MTYYDDLSPYTYLPEAVSDGAAVLNVGWIDHEHPYPTGEPPEHFIERLGSLCAEHSMVRTRGFHWCELGPEDNDAEYRGGETINGVQVPLGSAEVRVLTPTGDILAAPNLIYHYVLKHSYLPPEPFIEAVLALRIAPEPEL